MPAWHDVRQHQFDMMYNTCFAWCMLHQSDVMYITQVDLLYDSAILTWCMSHQFDVMYDHTG